MITNKERKARSKERQRLGELLRLWAQKIKDMEVAVSLDVPEAAQKLSFSRQEHAKAVAAMRKLNRGTAKQRAWVSNGLKY